MKYKNRLLLSILLILSSQCLNAQWIQTNGPIGGITYSIERVGNEIWASSDAGISVSTDEGETWSNHPKFGHKYKRATINAEADTIIITYALSFSEYPDVYTITSLDGGINWSQETFLEHMGLLHFLYKVKRVNNDYYANLYYHGGMVRSYVSHNYGEAWERVFDSNELPMQHTTGMINNKGILTSNFSVDTSNLFYSKGRNDSTIIIKHPYKFSSALLVDTSIIMIAEGDNPLIVKTDNYGETWDTLYIADQFEYGYISLNNLDGTLFISGEYPNCLESKDNGITWNLLMELPFYFYKLKFQDFVKTSTSEYLSVDNYQGVIRYNQLNNQPRVKSDGLEAHTIQFVKSHKDVLYASDSYNFYCSKDEGLNWKFVNPYFHRVISGFCSGDTLLFLSIKYGGLSLIRSFDNGMTWDSVPGPPHFSDFHEYNMVRYKNKLYLNNGYLYSSDNLGNSWTQLPLLSKLPEVVCPFYPDFAGYPIILNDNLVVVTRAGHLYKFNMDLQKWQYYSCYIPNNIFIYPKIVETKGTVVIYTSTEFRYSSDGGITFYEPDMKGIPSLPFNERPRPTEFLEHNNVWYGSFDSLGVFYTLDKGENWQSISIPDKFHAEGGLAVVSDVLFSGSKSSVWKRSGPLNFATGYVYREINQNGIQDPNEPSVSDVIIRSQKSGTTCSTNSSGFYSLLSEHPSDTITVGNNQSWEQIDPIFHTTDSSFDNKIFSVFIDDRLRELSIDITNTGVFRSGFETELVVTARNNGGEEVVTKIEIDIGDKLEFLSASIPESSQIGNKIIWDTPLLKYKELFSLTIKVKTVSSIFDTVSVHGNVTPLAMDILPENNTYILKDIVVGSYDPNDKTCVQGDYFTPDQISQGEEIQYIIRFQNEGNYKADNVYITDRLDTEFDLNTIRIISSSHDMNWQLDENGIVTFYFNNINLPDKASNELLSHGYVKFGIKCNKNTFLGSIIQNKADIYFDFNTSIETNKVSTLVNYPPVLNTDNDPELVFGKNILVYPNPVESFLVIDKKIITDEKIHTQIYDVNGRRRLSIDISSNNHIIEISHLTPGIYFGIIFNTKNEKIGNFRFIVK